MNKLGYLAASVSALALMSSGAYANAYLPGAGHHQLTAEEIAQLPQQKDMNRQREFTVFLKPGAAGSADLVQNYFKGFGFQTEYFPYTNTVKLLGSYAQAERAGNFTYVAGRLSIVPLRPSQKPTFPPAVANATGHDLQAGTGDDAAEADVHDQHADDDAGARRRLWARALQIGFRGHLRL